MPGGGGTAAAACLCLSAASVKDKHGNDNVGRSRLVLYLDDSRAKRIAAFSIDFVFKNAARPTTIPSTHNKHGVGGGENRKLKRVLVLLHAPVATPVVHTYEPNEKTRA